VSDKFLLEANGTQTGKVHIAMAGIEGIQSQDEILIFTFKVIDQSIENIKTRLTLVRAVANDRIIKAMPEGEVIFAESEAEPLPEDYALFQNYPNPFNSETQIYFQIPRFSRVRITVYNLMGNEIRVIMNGNKSPGSYRVNWDGKDNQGLVMPSGIYIFELKADGFSQSKKMIVMK